MKIQIANSNALESINKIRKAITEDTTSGHNLADIGEMEIKKTDKQITFMVLNHPIFLGGPDVMGNNLFCPTYNDLIPVSVEYGLN